MEVSEYYDTTAEDCVIGLEEEQLSVAGELTEKGAKLSRDIYAWRYRYLELYTNWLYTAGNPQTPEEIEAEGLIRPEKPKRKGRGRPGPVKKWADPNEYDYSDAWDYEGQWDDEAIDWWEDEYGRGRGRTSALRDIEPVYTEKNLAKKLEKQGRIFEDLEFDDQYPALVFVLDPDDERLGQPLKDFDTLEPVDRNDPILKAPVNYDAQPLDADLMRRIYKHARRWWLQELGYPSWTPKADEDCRKFLLKFGQAIEPEFDIAVVARLLTKMSNY